MYRVIVLMVKKMNILKKIMSEVVVFSIIIALVLGNLLTKFSYIDLGYLIIVVVYFIRFLYIDIRNERNNLENDI